MPLILSFVRQLVRAQGLSIRYGGTQSLRCFGAASKHIGSTSSAPTSSKTLSSPALDETHYSSSVSPYLSPIGALTSKPYAFTTRSWELKSTESVDVFDGIGSNIRVDTRGAEIMRILPRLNEAVNEEWISDKSRFAYDGLKTQRLNTPMAKNKKGEMVPMTWDKARILLKHKVAMLDRLNPDGYEAHAVVGPQVDVNTLIQLRAQFYKYFPGGKIHIQEQPRGVNVDFRQNYILNTTLMDLELADCILLIGTNPRKEAPLLNTRIRKAVLYNHCEVALIGTPADLTYPVTHLGSSPATLDAMANKDHPFKSMLQKAKNPVIIASNTILQREDGASVNALVQKLAKDCKVVREDWNGFNVLHQGANTVGAMDIGFNDKNGGSGLELTSWKNTKFLYLLGADNFDKLDLPNDCFVVYQGSHGDNGANAADLILPGAAYTEKSSKYVNTEGRVQESKLAFFPPGQAMDDAEILRDICGPEVSNLSEIPTAGVEILAPHIEQGGLEPSDLIFAIGDDVVSPPKQNLEPTPFASPVENFYMTDPITRSSKTMAKCARVIKTSNFE